MRKYKKNSQKGKDEKAIEIIREKIKNGDEDFTFKEIMEEAGYTSSSAKGMSLSRATMWKSYLESFPTEKALLALYNALENGSISQQISASREILRLNNLYPQNSKNKHASEVQEVINELSTADFEEKED